MVVEKGNNKVCLVLVNHGDGEGRSMVVALFVTMGWGEEDIDAITNTIFGEPQPGEEEVDEKMKEQVQEQLEEEVMNKMGSEVKRRRRRRKSTSWKPRQKQLILMTLR